MNRKQPSKKKGSQSKNLRFKNPFHSQKTNIGRRLQKKCHDLAMKGMKETKKKSPRSGKKDTAPEKEVSQILERHNILYIREYQLFGKYYDFLVFDKNGEELCLLEIDGDYYHGKNQDKLNVMQVRNQIEDLYKNSIAAVNDMYLIRVWESEIDENSLVNQIQSYERQKVLNMRRKFN